LLSLSLSLSIYLFLSFSLFSLYTKQSFPVITDRPAGLMFFFWELGPSSGVLLLSSLQITGEYYYAVIKLLLMAIVLLWHIRNDLNYGIFFNHLTRYVSFQSKFYVKVISFMTIRQIKCQMIL